MAVISKVLSRDWLWASYDVEIFNTNFSVKIHVSPFFLGEFFTMKIIANKPNDPNPSTISYPFL